MDRISCAMTVDFQPFGGRPLGAFHISRGFENMARRRDVGGMSPEHSSDEGPSSSRDLDVGVSHFGVAHTLARRSLLVTWSRSEILNMKRQQDLSNTRRESASSFMGVRVSDR